MTTKYFAATLSDGQTVVRSSASRTYTHAVAVRWARYAPELWRAAWAGSLELACKNKAKEDGLKHNVAVELAEAREVTRAEYLQLKAIRDKAWGGLLMTEFENGPFGVRVTRKDGSSWTDLAHASLAKAQQHADYMTCNLPGNPDIASVDVIQTGW